MSKQTDFNSRLKMLDELAGQLREHSFTEKLTAAYMKDTGFLKKDIQEREIAAPLAVLEQAGMSTPYTAKFDVDFNRMQPLGKIAVLLPETGINVMMARMVCSSFLSGNRTIIKLPASLPHSVPYIRQLLENNINNIEFAPEEMSAASFTDRSAHCPDIKAVVIYATDRWMRGYRNLFRNSNTRLIFEGTGKNPFIVFPDADPEKAVEGALKAGLLNGGQSGYAAELFFIHDTLVDEFVQRLAERMALLAISEPEDEGADIGPIFSDAVLNRIISQVIDAKHKGGNIISGGKPVEIGHAGKLGFKPAIITGCTTDMQIVKESNFGPVFPILSFSSGTELITRLDQINDGLDAAVFGTMPVLVAAYLEKNYRSLCINSTMASPANYPSQILDGGYRDSGYIWEWQQNNFLQREGPRMLIRELCCRDAVN